MIHYEKDYQITFLICIQIIKSASNERAINKTLQIRGF